jgi:O-antigen/teichoic acid export membrane protein
MTNPVLQTAAEATGGATVSSNRGARVQARQLVARNTLALVFAQFITTPVSILVNAILARSLGASDFGTIYLASTILTVGFLVVEWGGLGQVAAAVARNRSDSAAIFGTGVVLRLAFSSALLLLIGPFARVMGYGATVRMALALVGIKLALVSLSSLCSSILRGFERLKWYARAAVFANLLDASLVIPTLLIGGRLQAVLTVQAAAAAGALMVQIVLVMKLRIGRPRIRRAALSMLLGGGFGFLLLDLVLKLQPYIDAAFLSRLAPSAALGWYGAASRIVGVLIFPVTTLTLALYPTLARLWKEDRGTYDSMVRLGIRTVMVLGIFAATGTVLFSNLIVRLLFGAERFGPAADDLAVLAGYVLLVYTSILLSAAIGAAGRQLLWALAQSFCLVVSVVLDPILIPYFQARFGNGSLGVCVSVVVAEVAMVGAGLLLVPAGSLEASLRSTLLRTLTAAAGMGAVGFILRSMAPVAIPATVVSYFGILWLLKELDPGMLALARSILLPKTARPAPSGD